MSVLATSTDQSVPGKTMDFPANNKNGLVCLMNVQELADMIIGNLIPSVRDLTALASTCESMRARVARSHVSLLNSQLNLLFAFPSRINR